MWSERQLTTYREQGFSGTARADPAGSDRAIALGGRRNDVRAGRQPAGGTRGAREERPGALGVLHAPQCAAVPRAVPLGADRPGRSSRYSETTLTSSTAS